MGRPARADPDCWASPAAAPTSTLQDFLLSSPASKVGLFSRLPPTPEGEVAGCAPGRPKSAAGFGWPGEMDLLCWRLFVVFVDPEAGLPEAIGCAIPGRGRISTALLRLGKNFPPGACREQGSLPAPAPADPEGRPFMSETRMESRELLR